MGGQKIMCAKTGTYQLNG